MRVGRELMLMLALIGASVQPGPAQDASSAREGFWWGAGFGAGWVQVGCDICEANRGMSFSGSLRAGGRLGPTLRLGGEASGWLEGEGDVDERLGALSLVLYWTPRVQGRLQLKGGLAYAAFGIDDGEDSLTASGFGPHIGIGYEVPVGRRMALLPHFNTLITIPTGHLQFNGDRQATGVSLALLQVGLGLVWH